MGCEEQGRQELARRRQRPAAQEQHEEQQGDLLISTDRARLDLGVMHAFLSDRSYWAAGIPREVLVRAIEGSLCFGVYRDGRQVGFARVVTDAATFAYLCDVFVLEEARSKGVGKWMMACVMRHPSLQGLRRFILATRDAHGLYQQYGFAPLKNPNSIMEIVNREVYRS